jgi:hypothetical protein
MRSRPSPVAVAVMLGAWLSAGLLPSVALGRDKRKEIAFATFLQSVAMQGTARLCVRGIPGYRERFDRLFARWYGERRDVIALGEVAFREEKSKSDLPPAYRAKLDEVDNVVAGLARPAVQGDPIELDQRWREECERILTDLDKEP